MASGTTIQRSNQLSYLGMGARAGAGAPCADGVFYGYRGTEASAGRGAWVCMGCRHWAEREKTSAYPPECRTGRSKEGLPWWGGCMFNIAITECRCSAAFPNAETYA